MKLSKSMRIWNVIYPVAIYFVPADDDVVDAEVVDDDDKDNK